MWTLFLIFYLLLLAIFSCFGVHKLWMVLVTLLSRHNGRSERFDRDYLPAVTVQIPVYNEGAIVEGVIRACALLDYPPELLQVQVLDDSTDSTSSFVESSIAKLRNERVDLDISHIRRAHRSGFKAGALRDAMGIAKGEIVAIFDADFLPRPDFLKKTLGYFIDNRVAMVQTRWSYFNRFESFLTRAQAGLLDAHFSLEHGSRHLSGSFFNFNGTAGLWRKKAIEDAGGWQDHTLTEDLDLSYRAQLKGWKFVYDDSIEAPSKLPSEIFAFKNQQRRWNLGTVQVLKKLLKPIRTSNYSAKIKLQAFLHLAAPLAFLGVVLFPLLSLFLTAGVAAGYTVPAWFSYTVVACLSVGITSVFIFYLTAAVMRGGWRLSSLYSAISAVVLGAGLGVSASFAVLEGLRSKKYEFERTPKEIDFGLGLSFAKGQRLWLVGFELMLLCFILFDLSFRASKNQYEPFPLLLIVGVSLTYYVYNACNVLFKQAIVSNDCKYSPSLPISGDRKRQKSSTYTRYDSGFRHFRSPDLDKDGEHSPYTDNYSPRSE